MGGRLYLVHEAVVTNAVLDYELRPADRLGHAGAGLELVGVGVRVAHYRRYAHVAAPDLRNDVCVLVLGPDGDDPRGVGAGEGRPVCGDQGPEGDGCHHRDGRRGHGLQGTSEIGREAHRDMLHRDSVSVQVGNGA